MLTIQLRRSTAVVALPAIVVVLVLHVVLRARPWVHEWLWAFDAYEFSFVLIGPVAAGIAAWDGAAWASSKDAARVAGRPGAPLLRSWLATTAWVWSIFLVGLLATLAYVAVEGAPGWPGLRPWSTVVPPLAVLALCTAFGTATGWWLRRVLVAPLVAVVTFGGLVTAYTGLPGPFLEVAGATSSLIGLAPRPGLQVAQSVWALGLALLFLVFAAGEERSRLLRTVAVVVLVAVIAGASLEVGRADGLRFRNSAVAARCDRAATPVCLVDGYEHLRRALHAQFDPAVAAIDGTGLARVKRITQDIHSMGAGVVIVSTRFPDDEEVVAALMPLLVPSDCEEPDPTTAYQRWLGVHDWLASVVSGVPLDERAPAELRQGGEVARHWVEDAVTRLRRCSR